MGRWVLAYAEVWHMLGWQWKKQVFRSVEEESLVR
jgi:hypothetical protein